jgi:hypothetical protein
MMAPIDYDPIIRVYSDSAGKSTQAGFADVKVNLLILTGTPYISEEFDPNSPPANLKKFRDSRNYVIANLGSDCVIHNLSAYSFFRVDSFLRGIPSSSIDSIVEGLKSEIEGILKSREAMLQFYSARKIPVNFF